MNAIQIFRLHFRFANLRGSFHFPVWIVFFIISGGTVGNVFSQVFFDRTYFSGSGLPFYYSEVGNRAGGGIWASGTSISPLYNSQFLLAFTDSIGYPENAFEVGTAGADSLHFSIPSSGEGRILVGKTNVRGEIDMMLIWVDSLGMVIRQKVLDWGDDDLALCGQSLPDGGILLGGRVEDIGAGQTDGFLLKLDSLGNPLAGRTMGLSQSDEVVDLVWQNNLVVVAGHIRGRWSTVDTTPDIFLKGFYFSNLNPVGNKSLVFGQPNFPDRITDLVYLGPAGYRLVGVGGERGNPFWPARGQIFSVSNSFSLTKSIEVASILPGGGVAQMGFYKVRSFPGGSLQVMGVYQDLARQAIAWSKWSLGLDTLGGNQMLWNNTLGMAKLGTGWVVRNSGEILLSQLSGFLGQPLQSGLYQPLPNVPNSCPSAPFSLSISTISPITSNNLTTQTATGMMAWNIPIFQSPISLIPQTRCGNCAVTASISGLPDTLCFGDTAILRSSGSGGYQFRWKVDGILLGTADSLHFSPQNAGMRAITLVCATPDGFCMDSITDSVWIPPLPQGGFSVSQDDPWVEVEDTLFSADSVSYDWGDGTTHSTFHAGGHIYSIPAGGVSYTIVQTAYYGCGTTYDTVVVTLKCPPLTAKCSGGCCGNQGKFKDMTQSHCSYSVEWNFGDGTTSTDFFPIHSYPVPDTVDSVFCVRLVADNGEMQDTTYLDVHTGGSYEVVTWPPAKSPIIPLSWERPGYTFIGDANGNKVEDDLENGIGGGLVDAIVAVRNCYYSVTTAITPMVNSYTLSDHLGVIMVEQVDSQGLMAIAALPDVAMIFHDFPLQLALPGNGPLANAQNPGFGGNFSLITDSFPEASGIGVGIGILGQGVREQNFPGLGKDKVFRMYDAILDTLTNPLSNHSFTSQIAAVAVGGYNPGDSLEGAAQAARLADIRVVDDMGYSRRSSWIRAVDYAIDSSFVQILLVPFVLPGLTDGTDPVSEAVNMAALHQIITVVAAGENGLGTLGTPALGAPALAEEAITVGACDSAAVNISGIPVFDAPRKKPDLRALGMNMRAAAFSGGGFVLHRNEGPAFAAAVVAGFLAQLKSVRPDLQPPTLKQLLLGNCQDLGPMGWDGLWGHGNFRPLSTLSYAQDDTLEYVNHIDTCLGRDDSPCIQLNSRQYGAVFADSLDTVLVRLKVDLVPVPKGTFLRLLVVKYGLREAYLKLGEDINLDSLSVGEHVFSIPVRWPGDSPMGYCLEAVIYNPLDRDFTNDRIRGNISGEEVNYGDASTANLLVGNPSCDCGDLLASLRDSLDECYRISLDTVPLSFCNGACPTFLPVTIQLDTACCNDLAQDTTLNKAARHGGCCDTEKVFRIIGRRLPDLGGGCCYSYENGASIILKIDSTTIPKVQPSISFFQGINDTLHFSALNLGTQPFYKCHWEINGKTYMGNTVKDTFWAPGSPPVPVYCKLWMESLCNCDSAEQTVSLVSTPSRENQIEASSAFPQVFPNPATDHFTVSIGEGWSEDWELEWVDMTGKVLKKWYGREGIPSQATITVWISDIPAGVYGLRLRSREREWSEKLVILRGQ